MFITIHQMYVLIAFIALVFYVCIDPQRRVHFTEDYIISLCVDICVAATIAAVSIMFRPPLFPF